MKNNANEFTELVFNELNSLINQSGLSMAKIASLMPAYKNRQSFGKAFNDRTMKLPMIYTLAEALGKRMVVRFIDPGKEDTDIVREPSAGYESKPAQPEDPNMVDQLKSNLQDLRYTIVVQKQMIKILNEELNRLKK